LFLELLSDSKRGDYVPAGASARKNRPHVVTINWNDR
jgi:hypothetical protein